MIEKDVLLAIRELRDELARRHGGDALSLAKELADRSRLAGREVIRLPRREPQPPRAPIPQPAA